MRFGFPLLDLSQWQEVEEQQTPILRSGLQVLKYGRSERLEEKLHEILEQLRELAGTGQLEVWVRAIRVYLMAVNRRMSTEEVDRMFLINEPMAPRPWRGWLSGGLIACWLSCLPVLAQSPEGEPAESSVQEVSSSDSGSVEQTAESEDFPDLSIPDDADAKRLREVLRRAKRAEPRSPDQYRAMQTAIRDAARALLQQLDPHENADEYETLELDAITASVSLMAFFDRERREATLEKLRTFLSEREQLSLQDVQTGLMAATMLEMQPNKQPARDIYALLDELLAADERPEMQALRVNLQAATRRLDLLGERFELEAQSLAGKTIHTEDFADKFLLVDFFATWCQPCVAQVPRLKQHYEKYRDRGLEVIAISLDEDEKALETYLEEQQLPWPVIHDNAEDPDERLQMRFGISSLPTVLLLNKEGTVVSLEAHGAELDRLMQMLFESPTPAEPEDPEPKDER